ncbi:Arf family guanine nucleotide exchange factor [Pichia kluyveri]|uniref:Arf family guanine nucleotide exchange factor n=1 Tax=Pichia kluyveri TaxID=36015 RepID=A0AAV5R9Q6_PICKL|nr:Arf family guanine nucleotide exchange factor [Pichia kluyveri]
MSLKEGHRGIRNDVGVQQNSMPANISELSISRHLSEISEVNSLENDDNDSDDIEYQNVKQKKMSTKLKNSTSWLPSRKLKTTTVDSMDSKLLSKKTNIGESKQSKLQKNVKRLSISSSSLIPKRFSSMSSISNQTDTPLSDHSFINIPKSKNSKNRISSNSSIIPIIQSPTKREFNNIPDVPLSPERSSMNNTLSIKPSSPIQPPLNSSDLNRNSSFSSSTPSEKSTIGKSLNMLKRTTKSIFFMDSHSTITSTSRCSDDSENYSLENELPVIRRSISYTDAERREIISYVNLDDSLPSKSQQAYFNTMRLNSKNTISPNKPLKEELESRRNIKHNRVSNSHLRQRSKTMDTIDNPLIDLAGSNTGLLSSITNFVKINSNSATSSTLRHSNSSSSSTASLHTHQPPTAPSKMKNLNISEDETPEQFINKLLKIYPLTSISEILSLEDNDLARRSLEYYLETYYDFKHEPLDFSLRKFLMLNYLPKETQQIDRLIYQFAKRYYNCNSDLGLTEDNVYILTYSLIMVHTDKFNPNNKRKMTRFEFIQNVLDAIEDNNNGPRYSQLTTLIVKELLGYLFDNITYTPLIKILPEQSELSLLALQSKGSLLFPYPNTTFLNGHSYSKCAANDNNRNFIISGPISNQSSASLTKSTPQYSISSPAVVRKKSTSFLWSGPTMIDPYDTIIKNDISYMNQLKLFKVKDNDIKLNCLNPFLPASNDHIYNGDDFETPSIEMINNQLDDYSKQIEEEIDSATLIKIWNTLTKSNVEFTLKIPKNKGQYLNSFDTIVKPLNASTSIEEYYLTRVIKIGIIDKQEISSTPPVTTIPVPEPVLNDITNITDIENKTSLNDHIQNDKTKNKSNQNKIWKPYFCILTTVGMFFFEGVSQFRMRFCGISPEDNTKTVIIEDLKDSISPNSSNTDSSTFMTFPYFSKSEKETVQTKNNLPAFIIGSDSFATRKIQNLEYDRIINTSISSPTELNEKDVHKNENDTIKVQKRSSSKKSKDNNSKFAKYTFFIYGKNFKNLYMVSSLVDVKSWIYSINIMSSLSKIKMKQQPLDYHSIPRNRLDVFSGAHDEPKYYEVVPVGTVSINRKIKSMKIKEHEYKYTSLENERSPQKKQSENINQTRIRSNTTVLDHTKHSVSDMNTITPVHSLNFNKDVSGAISGSEDSDHELVDAFENANLSMNTVDDIINEISRHSTNNVEVSNNRQQSSEVASISSKNYILSSSSTISSLDSHDSKFMFDKNTDDQNDLLEHLYSVKQLLITTPLQKKTTEELLSTAKILSIKLEWLWYEKCKSKTLELILRRLQHYSHNNIAESKTNN